jgi:hypothetical protein
MTNTTPDIPRKPDPAKQDNPAPPARPGQLPIKDDEPGSIPYPPDPPITG